MKGLLPLFQLHTKIDSRERENLLQAYVCILPVDTYKTTSQHFNTVVDVH